MSHPNTIPSDDDQGLSGYADSPGRRLRELRESRGIEIERITAQLHLARDVVDALEQDRYADLPSPVFVAGYFKNYARLLGIDPEPILRAYRSSAPDQETVVARPAAGPNRTAPAQGGRSWTWLIGLVLIGVAIVAVLFWWQGSAVVQFGEQASESAEQAGETAGRGALAQNEAASATDATDASETTPIDSFGSAVSVPSDAIPLRGTESATGARPADTAMDADESVAEEDDTATIPATSLPIEPQPTQPAPPTETREILLAFSGTSWVDVRDATGKVVLNGEMREGDQRTLTGEPPFKLVIGNAAATKLTVGDDAFDLGSHARGNVARFSLDPDTFLDPSTRQ